MKLKSGILAGLAVAVVVTAPGAFYTVGEVEQAIIYVRARGNHSLQEKDALLRQAEAIAQAQPGVESVFAFAGAGGLNQNTGGAQAPLDTIGQIQLELTPWEDRRHVDTDWIFGLSRQVVDPAYDGDIVLDQMEAKLRALGYLGDDGGDQ